MASPRIGGHCVGMVHCLNEMKKDEEKRMEVKQQKVVSRMVASADGQVFCTRLPKQRHGEEEEECIFRAVEEKGIQWAQHWQCESELEKLEDKPWRNEEFKVRKKEFQG